MGKSEVEAHMTTKGGIRGLPAQFLLEKARYFSRMKSTVAFEAIFVLLAYELFLFPNVDKFVDINVIRTFMIGNSVPTLLVDAYYSIHLWNSYQGGMIICCTLLYPKICPPIFFKNCQVKASKSPQGIAQFKGLLTVKIRVLVLAK